MKVITCVRVFCYTSFNQSIMHTHVLHCNSEICKEYTFSNKRKKEKKKITYTSNH